MVNRYINWTSKIKQVPSRIKWIELVNKVLIVNGYICFVVILTAYERIELTSANINDISKASN